MLEFRVKLSGERLVMRNDERWPVQLLDHVRDGESFTRARDTEQRLMPITGLNRLQELANCLSLVTSRFVVRFEPKWHLVM